MKKNYDKWKIITTLITIIFIAVMVVLNIINWTAEKNSLPKSENKISLPQN